MLNDIELKEIETTAVELAREAGQLLLRYFEGPLQVDYKTANNRNPVTDADKAADEYLRSEINRRYPDHGVLTEESEADDKAHPEVVWVIDPLDGTSNFLNGIPLFCVLVAVLEQGKPVVGAIFLPDVHRPEGRVLHSRVGGGAFDEDMPLSLALAEEPLRRMAAWPSYFLRMFAFKSGLRRRLGDVRSIGSAGYELALAGRGVFDYVVLSGLWSWDMAAGLAIVTEAGGSALQYDRKSRSWMPFDRFTVPQAGEVPTVAELGKWRGVIVVGRTDAVEFITNGIIIPRIFWWRVRSRIEGWFAKLLRRPQTQGQGRSRRE